jgi:hypothetical protein
MQFDENFKKCKSELSYEKQSNTKTKNEEPKVENLES